MTRQLQLSAPIQGAVDPAAGERAKDDGLAATRAATAPDWATACRTAIEELARRGEVFQAADLIAEGLVGEPDHPSRWGGALGSAARAGLIVEAGYVPSKRTTVRRSICKAWVGVGTQQGRAAA
ncbi:hypothetical protein ACWCWD_06545 [Streptomyces sp. NPDC001493]